MNIVPIGRILGSTRLAMPTADHILSYAEDLRGGGVERAQLRLIRAWIAAGRHVTLLLGSDAGPLAAELPPGVAVVTGMTWRTLPGMVRDAAPDIIFCPGNHYTGLAAWTRLRLGAACPPIVGKMSNAPVRGDHGRAMRRVHAAWLATHGLFLDHLVAMTPNTAAQAAAALRMTGRVSVIPNPPAAAIAGSAQPALPDRYILGVGRLEPQKRWDRLIAAMPALAAPIPLVILGEGTARSALTAHVAALGLGDRVHLLGHVADPFPAMAGAAVLALTSDFEGVPGVLREALSVGTPVVSTASSRAVAEIVEDAALGTIVPLEDRRALVAALDHWLVTPRPVPVPQPGADSAASYLALFDRLVS
ncbi:glycosyltransferase [Sphingomonas sp. PB2P19]|uniref:glycosyltransferase n=1 Tax=Sphingomonas rhamnosi TaxID=3096156 RepID=UPI002FCA901E